MSHWWIEMFFTLLLMVYILRSLLVRLCSDASDFNKRNIFWSAKLLKEGYQYRKPCKVFSKFYHRHSEVIVKCTILV